MKINPFSLWFEENIVHNFDGCDLRLARGYVLDYRESEHAYGGQHNSVTGKNWKAKLPLKPRIKTFIQLSLWRWWNNAPANYNFAHKIIPIHSIVHTYGNK